MNRRRFMRGFWYVAARAFALIEDAAWNCRLFCIMRRMRWLDGM